jgi:hypothetical protein
MLTTIINQMGFYLNDATTNTTGVGFISTFSYWLVVSAKKCKMNFINS